MFAKFSYRPRFGFVTGGYTECYVDCADVIDTTLKLFWLIADERGECGPTDIPKKLRDPFANKHVKLHEQLMKEEKEKIFAARESILIEASVMARRARQRKSEPSKPKKHKTPSVDLLKNQSL